MNSEFDTWYTDYIDDDNKSVREAAKAAWCFMQSRLEQAEKDAARYQMIRSQGNIALDTKESCIFDRDGWEIHGLLQGEQLDSEIDTAMKSAKESQ